MPSARLAFTLVALVASLTALDLSGVHRPVNADAGYDSVGSQPAVASMALHGWRDGQEGHLVQTLLRSEATPMQGRAVHLCVDGNISDRAARYCFGTPAPTVDYH